MVRRFNCGIVRGTSPGDYEGFVVFCFRFVKNLLLQVRKQFRNLGDLL